MILNRQKSFLYHPEYFKQNIFHFFKQNACLILKRYYLYRVEINQANPSVDFDITLQFHNAIYLTFKFYLNIGSPKLHILYIFYKLGKYFFFKTWIAFKIYNQVPLGCDFVFSIELQILRLQCIEYFHFSTDTVWIFQSNSKWQPLITSRIWHACVVCTNNNVIIVTYVFIGDTSTSTITMIRCLCHAVNPAMAYIRST